MERIGFSTGALAYGDFRRGLALQSGRGLNAVELSALRDVELVPLVDSIPQLDLTAFAYISFHAPSRISTLSELEIIRILAGGVPAQWPIIVHPDVIKDVRAWEELGNRLCIENMDQRKPVGRAPEELRPFFERLPEARLCLDLAHARQVDPTMSIAYHIIEEFGDRLVQLHVSDVNDESRHVAINAASIVAYQRIAPYLPACPWIIESVIPHEAIDREIAMVRRSLRETTVRERRMSLVD
jgi:hypothetical protein